MAKKLIKRKMPVTVANKLNILTNKWSEFKEFCRDVDEYVEFSGFKNVVDIKNHLYERLLWLFMIFSACAGVVYTCRYQWNRYVANPTVISLERDYRSWMGKLPAVTLCYLNKVDPARADQFIQILWEVNSTHSDYQYYYDFVESIAMATAGNFQAILKFENDDRFENVDLKHLAKAVHPRFNHVITTFDKQVTVRTNEFFTERGLCYVINAPLSMYIRQSGTKDIIDLPNPVSCFFAKHQCFMKLDVYNSSASIQVHSPYETPFYDSQDFHLNRADEIVAMYKVIETVVGDAVKDLTIQQRKCIFHSEMIGNNAQLSGNFCFMKCRAETAMELCRCKPHFYPFLSGPECSLSGFICLQKFSWPIWSLRVCKCPKICNELKYSESNIYKRTWSVGSLPFMEKSSFRWELLTPKVRLRRDVLFSFEDFLVSTRANRIDLYRPPAARKLATNTTPTCSPTYLSSSIIASNNSIGISQDNHSTASDTNYKSVNNIQQACTIDSTNINDVAGSKVSAPKLRERRPDRAVYVPRARRSQNTPPTPITTVSKKSIPSDSHQEKTSANYTTTNSLEINSEHHSAVNDNLALTCERINFNNLCNNNNNYSEESINFHGRNKSNSHSVCDLKEKSLTASIVDNISLLNKSTSKLTTSNISNDMNTINNKTSIPSNTKINKSCTMDSDDSALMKSMRIDNVSHYEKDIVNKIDVEDIEFQRASKEINRSNRRIIKQTFVSNVLEIVDPIHDTKCIDKDENMINDNGMHTIDNSRSVNVDGNIIDDGDDYNGGGNCINRDNSDKCCNTSTKHICNNKIDPETDDWETMFDDNGDCLDPKLLNELTAAVDKVTINDKPKTDYKVYHMKQAILNLEEFPHVLEVSNFPVEFKTQDLMQIFSPYKESGFDIKWVDDTHALAVFSSSKIAAEVLSINHPFVLLKPLTEATIESRTKAKKCSNSLQPFRQRPDTCVALARRLVTGALGVRLKTARQELENERKVLREAKERKLLAAKQRDEAWES